MSDEPSKPASSLLRWTAPGVLLLLGYLLGTWVWLGGQQGASSLPPPLVFGVPIGASLLFFGARWFQKAPTRGGDLFLLWMIMALDLGHLMILLGVRDSGLDMDVLVPMGAALVYVGTGAMVNVLPPGSPFGVRMRSTLSSESVWRRTHRLLGALLAIAGILSAVSAITWPLWAQATMVISPSLALALTMGYAWLAEPGEDRRG